MMPGLAPLYQILSTRYHFVTYGTRRKEPLGEQPSPGSERVRSRSLITGSYHR